MAEATAILSDLRRQGFLRNEPKDFMIEEYHGELEHFLRRLREFCEAHKLSRLSFFSPSDPSPGAEVVVSVAEALNLIRKCVLAGVSGGIPEDIVLVSPEEEVVFYIPHSGDSMWIAEKKCDD